MHSDTGAGIKRGRFSYHRWEEFKDTRNRASGDFIKRKEIVHSQNIGRGQARRRASAPQNKEAKGFY